MDLQTFADNQNKAFTEQQAEDHKRWENNLRGLQDALNGQDIEDKMTNQLKNIIQNHPRKGKTQIELVLSGAPSQPYVIIFVGNTKVTGDYEKFKTEIGSRYGAKKEFTDMFQEWAKGFLEGYLDKSRLQSHIASWIDDKNNYDVKLGVKLDVMWDVSEE